MGKRDSEFFFEFRGEQRSEQTKDEVVVSGSVDFGIVDNKGRKLGSSWQVREVAYREISAEEWETRKAAGNTCYSLGRPGTRYTAGICALRNGSAFGAYHYPSYHATREEAEAACAKKVEASRKRYVKGFAAYNQPKAG